MPLSQEKAPQSVTPSTEAAAEAGQKKAMPFWESAYIVLFGLSMAFVILTPLDVLQRYPQAVPYVDWMASWNPHVHRLGLRHISGPWADANRFCAAVMWGVWTPWLATMYFTWFVCDEPIKPFKSVGEVFLGLIAAPLLVCLSIYGTGDLDSRIGRLMVVNPLGRSFFIPGAIGAFWFSVYMTFAMWRSAFRRNFDF